MRGFQRISEKQAHLDGISAAELEVIHLPERATKYSAGYDICSAVEVVIPPHSARKFPTGIRAMMGEDEVLFVHVRSSVGFKKNVRLSNCTGVIDSDYYFAANEGHIWVSLYNDSDVSFKIGQGERIVQGIFTKYLVIDGDKVAAQRTGGMGSTD